MGRYIVDQTDGSLSLISGRGKAEYGASTVRTGTVSIPQSSAGALNVVSVTFDTPMPDADYLVTFECSTAVIDLRLVSTDKTVSGFKIGYSATAATSSTSTVKYYAFKLYTDTEYNEVLERPQPHLFTVHFGSVTAGVAINSQETLSDLTSGVVTQRDGIKGISVLYQGGSNDFDYLTPILSTDNYIKIRPTVTQSNFFMKVALWY